VTVVEIVVLIADLAFFLYWVGSPLAGWRAPGIAAGSGLRGDVPQRLQLLVGPSCRSITQAVEDVVHGLAFDNTRDYISWGFSAHRRRLPADVMRLNGPALHRIVLDRTATWHPEFRELFRRTDPSTCFPINVRTSEPVAPWPTSSVPLVGDAIHTMMLGLGVEANTALRDARILADARIVVTASDTHFGDFRHNMGMVPGPVWRSPEALARTGAFAAPETTTAGRTAYSRTSCWAGPRRRAVPMSIAAESPGHPKSRTTRSASASSETPSNSSARRTPPDLQALGRQPERQNRQPLLWEDRIWTARRSVIASFGAFSLARSAICLGESPMS
jgi:hypothetical protein